MSRISRVIRPAGLRTNVEVVLSSSISVPAVRMLYCVAEFELALGKMRSGFYVYPVVAIESRITQIHSINKNIPGDKSSFTLAQLTGEGWRQGLPERSFVPVIFDSLYFENCCPDEIGRDLGVSRTILSPWPADEDAERIKSVQQELMREAERVATDEAARKARKSRPA